MAKYTVNINGVAHDFQGLSKVKQVVNSEISSFVMKRQRYEVYVSCDDEIIIYRSEKFNYGRLRH